MLLSNMIYISAFKWLEKSQLELYISKLQSRVVVQIAYQSGGDEHEASH